MLSVGDPAVCVLRIKSLATSGTLTVAFVALIPSPRAAKRRVLPGRWNITTSLFLALTKFFPVKVVSGKISKLKGEAPREAPWRTRRLAPQRWSERLKPAK